MKKIVTVFFTFLLMHGVALAEPFPTIETVRYVIGCMADLGAQTDENLYTCSCRLDVISNELSYADYDDGVTYERNLAMPGEKGAFFRDNKRGEEKFELVKAARKDADNSCIAVKRVATPTKRNPSQ